MGIVLAKPEDLPLAMQLYTACMRAMRANGNEQWGDDYPTEEIIRKDIESGWMHLLLEEGAAEGGFGARGEKGGALISAIALNEVQAPEYKSVKWSAAERALVVHRLCVAPERQRSGIAMKMMDFAEERARREVYPSVRLDTYSGNPAALRLYERRAYRKTGEVFFRGRSLPFFCFEKIFAPGV